MACTEKWPCGTVGNFLEGSGWAATLTQAGIASSGTVDSFLKASHLIKTRYAHQASALALGKFQEVEFARTGECCQNRLGGRV